MRWRFISLLPHRGIGGVKLSFRPFLREEEEEEEVESSFRSLLSDRGGGAEQGFRSWFDGCRLFQIISRVVMFIYNLHILHLYKDVVVDVVWFTL